MWAGLTIEREDIGRLRFIVNYDNNEILYNSVDVCRFAGVQNVWSFICSMGFIDRNRSDVWFFDSKDYPVVFVTEKCLNLIFEKLKKDNYCPITLNQIIKWFDKEVFPYTKGCLKVIEEE